MRAFILLFFMFSLALNLQAQNYEITFTGSGGSSSVDEVQVVYLSKGDTIDISGTDVLKLKKNSGSSRSSTSSIELPYTDGDWILLKGISGNYQRVVTIAPAESQEINFEFVSCTDYDNNHYPAVSIGTQTWMAENLRAGSFNDGTEITHVEADALWESAATPAYSWYNNDQANDQILGKLYNWLSVGGEKNPCPSGWHVPSHDEYMVLHNYLIDNGYNVPPDRTDNTDNIGWAGKALAHITLWETHTRDGAIGNNQLLNTGQVFPFLLMGVEGQMGRLLTRGENGVFCGFQPRTKTIRIKRMIIF
jgi:uncharacterized protein (TIGR02145 family)